MALKRTYQVKSKYNPKKVRVSKKIKSRVDRDIPPPAKTDLRSISTWIPRISSSYVLKSRESGNFISGSSAAPVAGAYNFQLANAPNLSSFQTLFDQYRVLALDITFRPRGTDIAPGVTSISPMRVVIDYDDNTVAASANELDQYSNVMTIEAYQSARRAFCPAVALALYSGAFTSYGNRQRQWIDIASTTVQHYGLKWYVPICVTTTVPVWDILIDAYIEFKTVR